MNSHRNVEDKRQSQAPEPDALGLRELAMRAGLWAAACFVFATALPQPLVLAAFHQLLLFAGLTVALVASLRGLIPSRDHFGPHDVALILFALAALVGLFVDADGLRAFVETAQQPVPAAPADTVGP